MPFGFLRRGRSGAQAPEGAGTGGRPTTISFEGLTEESRISGRIEATGRLADALNRREPIRVTDVRRAPIDGTAPPERAPDVTSIDPYDLIVVHATGDGASEGDRDAYRVHRIPFDVALELPPLRVIGTVHLYPGSDPSRLLDRATEMFVPVVEAVAYLGDQVVTDPSVETILVNRFYLRGVEQIDKRTGERPQRLPGAPLGGVSWHDRSR